MHGREGERTELAGFNVSDLLVENTEEFAMFAVDLDGRNISWNPGVKNLFGYEQDEWVNQPAEIIFTDEDRAAGAAEMELLRAAKIGEAADIRWHVRKDGSRFWANGVMTALLTPEGRHVGFAKVVRDETEKKRLEVERERLVDQLREEHALVEALNAVLHDRLTEGIQELVDASAQLNREMSDRQEVEKSATRLATELSSQTEELESLTYSISHDLRSPLRGLDGFSQALLEDYEGILDETGKNYLRRIRASAQLIGDLIDNLLDLSRLSRRNMKWVEVDLSREVRTIVDRLRRGSPGRKVEVEITPQLVVHGDPEMLRGLLSNLLSNAWKFSSKEAVAKIEFGADRDEGEMRYFVRDNGVGFDMRYAGRLFAPFQRLHSSSQFEGTGVGLATARRIVRRHGGRIWAQAEPAEGAVFSFTIGSEPAKNATETRWTDPASEEAEEGTAERTS